MRRVLSALHMFRLGRRPIYMGAEFYTSVPMILSRLSTISSGYPQRDASYPHFYVDAGTLLARAELLFALLALVVLEIE